MSVAWIFRKISAVRCKNKLSAVSRVEFILDFINVGFQCFFLPSKFRVHLINELNELQRFTELENDQLL